MSQRIRGQEALLKLTIDGVPGDGTWLKVSDWKISPRDEIVETEFVGETASDLDYIHNGFDFSFSVEEQDDKVIVFIQTLQDRNQDGLTPPRITMQVINNYRESSSVVAENYYDALMRVTEHGAGGRKEYVKASIEGKCKKRNLVRAA